MPTPYDQHDPGFTREERRIAADYSVDLDASAQVRCDSCWQYCEAELVLRDNCPACVELMRREASAAFLTAPTMAGCKALMGQSVNTTGRAKWLALLAHEAAIVAAIPSLDGGK